MSHGHADDAGLTSVEDHLAEILGTIVPLAPTELSVGDAHGLVLAEDVAAASALPSFDNSAMDGYAVRVEDVAAATEEHPVTLPVAAEVAAGDTGAYALSPGTSIRIMTGAMLPHRTEAVVPVESRPTSGTARVTIRAKADYGHAIRLAGGDAKAGEVLVTAGTLLRPMHIAVIAAAGRGAVLVRPRPRVVVLSTGSELAEPGTRRPRRIWDSNSFMLAAAVREAGCLAYRQAVVHDHRRWCGPSRSGSGAGRPDDHHRRGRRFGSKHNVVKAALQVARLGTIAFRKVAMQPGMPQGFGSIAGVPIFTLPGNPVSAYVSFQVFARPGHRAHLHLRQHWPWRRSRPS